MDEQRQEDHLQPIYSSCFPIKEGLEDLPGAMEDRGG